MAKTATINFRIEPEIKQDAEELFSSLGMTLAEAINIFLHQSLIQGGLPFDVRKPMYSMEAIAALQEAQDIVSGKIKSKTYSSAKELFDEIEREDPDVDT